MSSKVLDIKARSVDDDMAKIGRVLIIDKEAEERTSTGAARGA